MGGIGSGRKKGSLNKKVVVIEGVPSKVCVGPNCNGNYAPISHFGNNLSYCLSCQVAKNEVDFIGYKINQIKRHTKNRRKKGKIYEVSSNLRCILEKKVQNQKYCYYSGVRLTEKIGDQNAWSADRIDFNKGYTEENIVLCTNLTNKVKGSIEYGMEQLIETYGRKNGMAALRKIMITILENYK